MLARVIYFAIGAGLFGGGLTIWNYAKRERLRRRYRRVAEAPWSLVTIHAIGFACIVTGPIMASYAFSAR